MAEQTWYQPFEAFEVIDYRLIASANGDNLAPHQPESLLGVLVRSFTAALPLFAALRIFRRKGYRATGRTGLSWPPAR